MRRRAALAWRRAVEIGDLFGEREAGAAAGRREFDGRERDRKVDVVEMHVVDIDDALIAHDVVVAGREERLRSAGKAAVKQFLAAKAKVEPALDQGPAVRPHEPAFLDGDVGPRGEDLRDGRLVAALDDECAVDDAAHRFFSVSRWAFGRSARTAPRWSR